MEIKIQIQHALPKWSEDSIKDQNYLHVSPFLRKWWWGVWWYLYFSNKMFVTHKIIIQLKSRVPCFKFVKCPEDAVVCTHSFYALGSKNLITNPNPIYSYSIHGICLKNKKSRKPLICSLKDCTLPHRKVKGVPPYYLCLSTLSISEHKLFFPGMY